MSSSPTAHAPYPVRVLLAASATVALSALGATALGTAASAAEVCPNTGGWTKVDLAQDWITSVTVTAPAGTVIVRTCVKAATDIAFGVVLHPMEGSR